MLLLFPRTQYRQMTTVRTELPSLGVRWNQASESFQLVAYLLTEPKEIPHGTRDGKGL